MEKSKMFQIVKDLEFDKEKTVFKKGDFSIYILRPSVLAKRFKDYNVNKNFQSIS